MERFAGRFVLVRRLGQGGMGHVWLALDHTSGTECALKRLDVRLPRSERDSLRKEFEVLARVRHPAVVSVYELGFAPDGTPFYTMEVVPGLPADLALRAGDWFGLFSVGARVTAGLEALHAAGVLHGDVKPSNLLVHAAPQPEEAPPSVRLVDFGLSALIDRDRKGHRGTPGFAAPEVVRGVPLSVASDLYSLGATLFVLAVGVARGVEGERGKPPRPPQDAQAAAIALEEAAVPGALAQLILRLMAAAPEARPGGAQEVRNELARLHPAARQPLSERLRSDVLVGRRHELARIERWLALAPRGAPLLQLSGDLGVGKTTLLREVAVRASLAGRTVISLSCAAGARPGETARTLILRLAAAAGTSGGDGAGATGARAVAGDGPRPDAALAEALQASDLPALVESAIEWGRQIQRQGSGPILLLDDAEHLDSLSRAFVRRMVSSEEGGVFRWVWASAAAISTGDPGDGLMGEAGLVDALALGPLDREHTDRLLAARLHSAAPAELADAIWTRCGGHPGWTIEVLRIATDAGTLRETEHGLTLDRAALDGVAWPGDLEDAFRRRLAQLGPAPAAAAAALAVWGGPARLADLAAFEPAADRAALESLAGAGLVTRASDGTYALKPPGLGGLVLSSMPEATRVRLHRGALERGDLPPEQAFRHHRGAGEPGEALGAAARALSATGDLQLAVEAASLAASQGPTIAAEWEERAGRLMLERGRYRESLPHFERAVALTPPGVARARRQHALSGAYLRTGATPQLEALLEGALATELPDRERALLLVNRSAGKMFAGMYGVARELGEEALRLAEASGDGEAEGLALIGLGSLALLANRAVDAQDLAKRASAAFVRARHALGRLRAENQLATALWSAQQHDVAERVCREALDEARRGDLRLAMHELLRTLSVILTEAGRWMETKLCEEEGLRLALEEGWPGLVGQSLTTVMILESLSGNPARALRRARPALRLVRKYQGRLEPTTLRAVAMACRTTGRVRRAARALRLAMGAVPGDGFRPELQWTGIEHGNLLARGGRWAGARRVWQAAYAEHPRVDSVASAILAIQIGRAGLRLNDPVSAEGLGAEAEAWLEGRTAAYAAAHARQLRAERALFRGELEAGVAAANEVLTAYSALPAPADAASAALEFARIALRGGVAARAPVAEWLQKAAAGFDVLGDRPNRERALALAVEWYRRYGASTPTVVRDRDLLNAVARLLDSLTDLSQLTREAMRLAVEQLDAERGVLLLADEDGVGLRPVVEHGAVDASTRDQAVSFSRAVVQRVASSGGSVVIVDASSQPETLSQSMVDLGLRSVLCVPLFVKSKVVGAVYLDDSRRPETFGVPERTLLEGFAHLLAIAIENGRGQDLARRTNEQLEGENLSLRREVGARFRSHNFIGGSMAIRRVLAVVERAAATKATVLITGENGTGKELIARMLHHAGPRSLKPFVAVNCGAIPEHLIGSDLFGHKRGAYTDAHRSRPGRFELANHGTLFLDEIGEMPMSQQVALLRVLAEGTVTPVGDERSIAVDVRVIAASNRDLARRMAEGLFREDLWYRLNVIPIEIPPLRERKADIPALARHFVATFASKMGRVPPTLAPALITALMQSDWPGNVRELENYIERLMAMTDGDVLEPSHLPWDLQQRAQAAPLGDRPGSLEDLVAELEKKRLLEALDRHHGNQTRAARELGLTEQSLRYRLRKYRMRQARRFRRTR